MRYLLTLVIALLLPAPALHAAAKSPALSEMRSALNEQLLLPNCSKMGILFGTGKAELVPLFSTVEAYEGWCATTTLGTRFNLRFGELRDMRCDATSSSQFSCSITYQVDCRIDSYASTEAGNRMICGLFSSVPSSGLAEVQRRDDGVLVVERFRANGNENFLRGVPPADAATLAKERALAKALVGQPDVAELTIELNRQLLPARCSQMDILFPKITNPAMSAQPDPGGSSEDGCNTTVFAFPVSLRFGEMQDIQCEPLSDDRFDCRIRYATDCELQGTAGTGSGGTTICDIFPSSSSYASVSTVRQADGALRIERFRSNDSDGTVEGTLSETSVVD